MPTSYADAVKKGKFEKSVYKFFLSFMVLADQDVSISIGTSNYDFPKRDIRISERFWRSDGCYRTGKCCSKVSMELFISSQELQKLNDIYPTGLQPWQAVQLHTRIAGRVYGAPTIWTSIGGKDCPYLVNCGPGGYQGMNLAGCSIHELNPIHCALPHVYFDLKNTKKPLDKQFVNVTKRQFGRNWAFGCPVEFISYNEFARKRDLLLFNRCKDLLIEFTGSAERCSDIIQRIEEREFLDIIPIQEVSSA